MRVNRGHSSVVEYLVCIQRVTSSNLVASTGSPAGGGWEFVVVFFWVWYTLVFFWGRIAQLVEQRTENPCVGSSSLPLATTPLSIIPPFFYHTLFYHTFFIIFFMKFLRSLSLVLVAALTATSLTTPAAAWEDEDAMVDLLRGFMLTHSGDYDTIVANLLRIGKDKNDPRMLRLAAQYARAHLSADEAIEVAEAWRDYADSPPAKQALAMLYMENQRYDEGAAIYEDLLAADAIETTDLLIGLLAIESPPDLLQRARQLLNTDDEKRVWLARVALAAGDMDTARAALDAFDMPQHWRAVFLRAQLLQVAEAGGDLVVGVLDRYIDEACFGQAIQCSQEAVLQGYLRFVARNENEIDAVLNAETPLQAEVDDWVLQGGMLLSELGLTAQALAYYERIPTVFRAAYERARIVEEQEGVGAALAILEGAAAKDNNDLALRESAVATLLQKEKRYDEALARLAAARAAVPDNFTLMYTFALIAEQSGDIDAALMALRKITRLFPNNSAGWNALGYVMADKNIDLMNARGYILRALRQEPNEPSYIDSLGWVSYRLGDLRAAERHLRRAYEGSDSPEIAAHLGEVLWEAGKRDEAAAVWAAAVENYPDNDVLNETIGRYQRDS